MKALAEGTESHIVNVVKMQAEDQNVVSGYSEVADIPRMLETRFISS